MEIWPLHQSSGQPPCGTWRPDLDFKLDSVSRLLTVSYQDVLGKIEAPSDGPRTYGGNMQTPLSSVGDRGNSRTSNNGTIWLYVAVHVSRVFHACFYGHAPAGCQGWWLRFHCTEDRLWEKIHIGGSQGMSTYLWVKMFVKKKKPVRGQKWANWRWNKRLSFIHRLAQALKSGELSDTGRDCI